VNSYYQIHGSGRFIGSSSQGCKTRVWDSSVRKSYEKSAQVDSERQSMNSRMRLLPLLILVAAVLAAWFIINLRADLPRKERVNVVPLVNVVSVEPGPIRVLIHSQGTVTPKREIDLVSEAAGRVVWVSPTFVTGGIVSKGEPLIRIDPIDYEVAVSEARANLASANLSLAEVKVVIRRAAIEEGEARVAAAKAELRLAQADLANTEITAPFKAVIDTKLVDLGQYVTSGLGVMRLLSIDSVEVRMPIVASDRAFIDTGQITDSDQAPIIFSAQFGEHQQKWAGQLTRIENRVDKLTRVFYVVGEVSEPYNDKLHGMPLSVGLFVEAEIEGIKLSHATRLPESALHEQSYVYLASNGYLNRRRVHVVRREKESVIISEGLQSGDQVVLSRLDLMVEGLPVAIDH